MSEATPEGGQDSGETPAADEFKAITSQDDLNKVINERLTRERAKFADYKDLKTKAARLDEIEQANQTEAEKAAAKVAELEAELNNTRRDSLRLKIASANGITDADDIDLFLTGTDEETLVKQAKRLAERTADRKKQGNHVPREGNNPKPGEDEMRTYTRGLFEQAATQG
jgi:hypothetical protein